MGIPGGVLLIFYIYIGLADFFWGQKFEIQYFFGFSEKITIFLGSEFFMDIFLGSAH